MHVAVVLVLLLAGAVPALAATVTGTVVDASGAPVPGAAVSVASGGQERRVTTGDAGTFEVSDVPEGEVQVRARAP
jgi:hypothetical protein